MVDTDSLEKLFINAFPDLDQPGQQQALQLYLLLAKGENVSIDLLASTLNLSTDDTEQLLTSWTGVSFNEQGLIDGFWGISTKETSHRFVVNQTTLYTWCAWDLLFMPIIYQQTIKAATTCPVSGHTIELTITPDGIEKAKPDTAMITFIKPSLEKIKEDVTGSFCQYVFFVDSEETGHQWQQQRSDGFLLNLKQGFNLGKKIIQQVFIDIQ